MKYIKIFLFILVAVLVGYVADTQPVAANDMFYGASLCAITPANPVAVSAVGPYVIAIDPGHGGVDTGAQHIVDEIDVINQTSLYLYRILEKDENFTPILTRDYESDPENAQRCETARNAGASLMISIHANCDGAKSTHGFECFPVPPGRTTHAESLRFAQLIAQSMKNSGHTLRGSQVKDGIKYAYYQGKSKLIVESTDTKIRSRKSFGILEKSPCPAVLVEQCFITNYEDVNNWTGETGCMRAANAYYDAIKEYFGL